MNNTLKTWRRIACEKVPMVAPVLFACKYVEDESAGIGTFCIQPDTLTITYSPAFAAKQKPEDNAFILAHEGLHYLCEHVKRGFEMKAREGTVYQPELFLMAEEIAVNTLCTSLGNWPVPAGGVQPVAAWQALSTEEIYFEMKTLVAQGKPLPNGMKVKKVTCLHKDSKPESANSANEMLKQQVLEAGMKEAQKVAGNLAGEHPGELRRLAIALNPLNKPPDFRELLRRYLLALDFNPKHMDPATIYRRRADICFPNLSSQPAARKFVVSIDNSGSIDDEMFGVFKGVLHSVAQQLGFQEIVIQHFTTEVVKTERVNDIRQVGKLARQANGGTAIEDADEKAGRERAQFHVILTDGYVGWLQNYTIPTVIVRTVSNTEKPPKVRNMIAELVIEKGS